MTFGSGFASSSHSSIRPFLKLLMPLATSPISPEILPVPNSSAKTDRAMRICGQLSPIDDSLLGPRGQYCGKGAAWVQASWGKAKSSASKMTIGTSLVQIPTRYLRIAHARASSGASSHNSIPRGNGPSRCSGLDADLSGHVRVEHAEVLHITRFGERE